MKKNLFLFLIAIICGLTFANKSVAQEIVANVTVSLEQLDFEARTNVATMERDIKEYLNKQSFTETEWKGPRIPVDVSIYLTGGAQNVYSARLIIVSRRLLDGPQEQANESMTLRVMDNKWSFEYMNGANFSYNPLRYNEVTSILDFYMLVIIGLDIDSYSELAGSPIFEKAKMIVQYGASAGADGWKLFSEAGELSKFNLISELTNPRYEDFRRLALDYYFDGMDKLAFSPDSAKLALVDIIESMADFKEKKLSGPSTLLQIYFDTKAQEIANLFNGYKNDRLYRNLKYIDPTHTALYDDAQSGKLK